MVTKCELLETCGFFKKHQATKNSACKGFIRIYCEGEKMDECVRKQYRKEHGKPPDDDMMPNGFSII